MSSFRELKSSLQAVSAIKTIATTYQEISQKEMSEIREKALSNRRFIAQLGKIYTISKKEYFKEKKESKEVFISQKKGKVVIFLSANARFYGSLLWAVWGGVKDYLSQNKADLVICAEVGKYFAQGLDFGGKSAYFDIDDENPNEEQVKAVIDYIKNYKEIIVFHGKFENILTQTPTKTVIPGEIPKKSDQEDISSYLFEPSSEKVLEFFETELLTAFFNQTFLEHRLSRHATRVVAMHQAGENAKERQEILKMTLKRLKRKELDKKQFEITGPLQLWN